MLKISNIPNEIYCQYEDIPINLEQLDKAEKIYEYETANRGFTNGGLEQAIYDYMTLQNNFNEDNGIFAGINGYEVQ